MTPSSSLRVATFRTAALLLTAAIAPLGGQEIPPLPPPGLDLRHVVIVSTGGEISSKCENRLNASHCDTGEGRLKAQELIADLPELRLLARVSADDRWDPGAADRETAIDHRHTIARHIQQIADDPGVNGIVVTHAAGTLAETAYFTNLVVRTRKPIVFVGAERLWSAISGDGPLNLYNAVRVAATPAAEGRGVLHAMNQEVHTARDVVQGAADRIGAFASIDSGLIGVTDPDVVRFFTESTRRHTYRSEFHVATLPTSLPPVEIVYTHAGSSGHVIEALVANRVRGIVIAGVWPEDRRGGASEAMKRALASGVVIVASSGRGGRVQLSGRQQGVIPGDNLVPEKARALLQLALTRTASREEIKRMFDEY